VTHVALGLCCVQVIIEVQHIAKNNKAIIGMSSTATSEDGTAPPLPPSSLPNTGAQINLGRQAWLIPCRPMTDAGVIKVINSWNDSHTEDSEAGPLHALNCFRAHVNITLPLYMAYLRPSLNINITAKPAVCSWWRPDGCMDWYNNWPLIKCAFDRLRASLCMLSTDFSGIYHIIRDVTVRTCAQLCSSWTSPGSSATARCSSSRACGRYPVSIICSHLFNSVCILWIAVSTTRGTVPIQWIQQGRVSAGPQQRRFSVDRHQCCD
jgi:hypothetical protein